ncbi:hypothetical protein VNO77_29505 [Canavalia gladiata]|uniref:Uncharacterized protein n=1 Tax=Canavalia gladiata TaxID=3824 RepID=A0AAN9L1M8_CANGL
MWWHNPNLLSVESWVQVTVSTPMEIAWLLSDKVLFCITCVMQNSTVQYSLALYIWGLYKDGHLPAVVRVASSYEFSWENSEKENKQGRYERERVIS